MMRSKEHVSRRSRHKSVYQPTMARFANDVNHNPILEQNENDDEESKYNVEKGGNLKTLKRTATA